MKRGRPPNDVANVVNEAMIPVLEEVTWRNFFELTKFREFRNYFVKMGNGT